MKKLFALLLALVVVASFTACDNNGPDVSETTTAEATTEKPISGVYQNYKYEEYSDHVVLTEYLAGEPNIWLPKTINGKPVTSFGTIFRASLTLSTINIPPNYTLIEPDAFAECFRLHSVTIEEGSMKKISTNAFYGCQALKYISVPGNVTVVEEDAFLYCSDLFVYGIAGSAIEEYVADFSSIYFREIQQESTVPETSKPDSTEEASTGRETENNTTTKPSASAEAATTQSA